MDETLQLLINHCETEQRLLQALLDDCLLEEDYKFAKYYSKNLKLIKNTLYNLYSSADYNHDAKSEVLRQISNIEFMSKKTSSNSFNIFREREMDKLTEKLSKLNEIPVKEIEEQYDLENAIINLVEGKIKGFKLFILKKSNFYLEFTFKQEDIIQVAFTPFKNLDEYFSIDEFEIKALQLMGFNLDHGILYIDFDLANQSMQSVKILLSRIFFEIFFWYSRKNFELVIY